MFLTEEYRHGYQVKSHRGRRQRGPVNIDAMVKDHQDDIAKYEREANSAGPAAAYAKAILPDLRKHLKVAQRLQQEERTASVSDESKSRMK